MIFRNHSHILICCSKEQHLFEKEICCNIMNVFSVTFDQFNAYLLNNYSFEYELKQEIKSPNLLNGCVWQLKWIRKDFKSHLKPLVESRFLWTAQCSQKTVPQKPSWAVSVPLAGTGRTGSKSSLRLGLISVKIHLEEKRQAINLIFLNKLRYTRSR